MSKISQFLELLQQELQDFNLKYILEQNEITLICKQRTELKPLLYCLRDHSSFKFAQLMDLCAVDYLLYGIEEWQTNSATETGFSRAVESRQTANRANPEGFEYNGPRFAIVYHLLSIAYNQRLRVKINLGPLVTAVLGNHEQSLTKELVEEILIVPSVIEIWKVANWFEREAYDLYGILFEGHADLRRILTDYGFIGHPFRKDFPLSGNVEMRYDAALQRVIYEEVSITPRTSVPKVIRQDNRYMNIENSTVKS